MASTYTHYRFAQDVLELLPEYIAKDIYCNKSLYDIGLHGPDILFYYGPLKSNPISKTGFGMHDVKADEILYNWIEKLGNIPLEQGLSYIYGFITHFALDSCVHRFVEDYIHESGVDHGTIEVEFDRILLHTDGFNPVKTNITTHIQPSNENARVIANFYDGIDFSHAKKALSSFIFFNDVLLAPCPIKRKVIYKLLKITGNYEKMKGLIISYKPNKLCKKSNIELYKRYKKALPIAVKLIIDFHNCLISGKSLDERFSHTFSHQDNE